MKRLLIIAVLFLVVSPSLAMGAPALCYWTLHNDMDGDTGPLLIRVVWDSGHTNTYGEGDSLPVGCNVDHYEVGNAGGPHGDLGIEARPPGCRGGAPVQIGVAPGSSQGSGLAMPGSINCVGCGTEPADCDDCGPGTDDIDCDGIENGEDPDIDGDGIPNEDDPDMDGDGIPNEDDDDMDGDGIPNEEDDEPCGPGSDRCTCLSPAPDDCDEPCENPPANDHDCDGILNECDKDYNTGCLDLDHNRVCDRCEGDDGPCEDPPANDHDCDGIDNGCDPDYRSCIDYNQNGVCDDCEDQERPPVPTHPGPELELPINGPSLPGVEIGSQPEWSLLVPVPNTEGVSGTLTVEPEGIWTGSLSGFQSPLGTAITRLGTWKAIVRGVLLLLISWRFCSAVLLMFWQLKD